MAAVRGKRIALEEYARFLQQIELRNVVLTSADVRRLGDTSLGARLEYEAKATKRTYEPVREGFQSTLNYLVRMKEVETGVPVGEVRVAITAYYSSDEPMTDEVFEVFGDLNLPLNVYPYVREFVHSATTRMGFPGLILPTVKRT